MRRARASSVVTGPAGARAFLLAPLFQREFGGGVDAPHRALAWAGIRSIAVDDLAMARMLLAPEHCVVICGPTEEPDTGLLQLFDPFGVFDDVTPADPQPDLLEDWTDEAILAARAFLDAGRRH